MHKEKHEEEEDEEEEKEEEEEEYLYFRVAFFGYSYCMTLAVKLNIWFGCSSTRL